MKALALLLALAGCYGGETEPQLGTQCSSGIATLDPEPGDCVVIRDNPLTPGCPYSYGFTEDHIYQACATCSAVESVGERLYLLDAEVAYGPLAPGEKCSCAYVSRSR